MLIVHHLSHIDLDGYGAQFVAREFFKNVRFYNANYGKEVSARLKQILRNIAGNSPLGLHSADFANLGRLAQTSSPALRPKFAKNHESQTENPSVVDFALAQNLGGNQTKSAESTLDSADSKQEANSAIADEFLGFCEASDDDRTKVHRGSEPMQSLKSRCESEFATHIKYLILITDLNLTLSEAKFLQSEADLLNAQGKKVQILLLDHHITGKDCAQNYSWYHLDESICATKITFQYLAQNLAEIDADSANAEILRDSAKMQRFAKFVDMIDSADTWKEGGFAFEFGKVALGMIAQSKEFSRYMFECFDNEFRFALLEKAQDFLLDSANNMRENAAVELDNNIFLFKKDILGGDRNRQTMEQILSHKQATLLSQNKEKYLVKCEGKKGIVTYGIGGISVVANLFLRQNADLDFFIDVGLRGNVSLRANGNCDVSEMAKEYFSGGGHKNAAGGRIEGFRETFLYEEAKAQVEAIFKNEAEDEDDEQWGL